MAVKKNVGRFTLHFNLNDPLQKAAVETLNRQGRHKAQLIARALSQYTEGGAISYIQRAPDLAEDALEQAILSVLSKHPDLLSGNGRTGITQEPDARTGPLQTERAAPTETLTQECRNAIQKTLASFCGK